MAVSNKTQQGTDHMQGARGELYIVFAKISFHDCNVLKNKICYSFMHEDFSQSLVIMIKRNGNVTFIFVLHTKLQMILFYKFANEFGIRRQWLKTGNECMLEYDV